MGKPGGGWIMMGGTPTIGGIPGLGIGNRFGTFMKGRGMPTMLGPGCIKRLDIAALLLKISFSVGCLLGGRGCCISKSAILNFESSRSIP